MSATIKWNRGWGGKSSNHNISVYEVKSVIIWLNRFYRWGQDKAYTV